ncbi:hypothetical protein QBC44DRAFT_308006 [Cladorrhinum sp. PSN332]|nr:hypothetical protein QBC44DRAFT_308006 [Cladorrhinum sp. PSN332]
MLDRRVGQWEVPDQPAVQTSHQDKDSSFPDIDTITADGFENDNRGECRDELFEPNLNAKIEAEQGAFNQTVSIDQLTSPPTVGILGRVLSLLRHDYHFPNLRVRRISSLPTEASSLEHTRFFPFPKIHPTHKTWGRPKPTPYESQLGQPWGPGIQTAQPVTYQTYHGPQFAQQATPMNVQVGMGFGRYDTSGSSFSQPTAETGPGAYNQTVPRDPIETLRIGQKITAPEQRRFSLL